MQNWHRGVWRTGRHRGSIFGIESDTIYHLVGYQRYRGRLQADHLAHRTFTTVNALDQAIHGAVEALNLERMVVPLAKPRISA
jgi:hypothetical protein